MSPSRSGQKKMQLLTNRKNPSPTYQNFYPDFARDSESSVNGGVLRRFIKHPFAEGSSLFTFLSQKVLAGMTVEATIVLPIFLLFIMNMGSALEMIRLHGNMQLGLWDIGRKLSLYGYVAEAGELWEENTRIAQNETDVGEQDEDGGFWKQLAEIIFVSTYVKGQLVEGLGEAYLDESPIVGGSDGLLLLESEVLTERDELEITVTYAVRPFGSLAEAFGFRMANKYYAHLWNGYEIPGTEENVATRMAYLAENAQVYHLTRDCSHLSLAVGQIQVAALEHVRNNYGERYTECKKCGMAGRVTADENIAGEGAGEFSETGAVGLSAICYIAEDGDCYHWDAACAGLKRTIRCVPLEEAKRYKPCSRCAKNLG